jgi:hypothetical protein
VREAVSEEPVAEVAEVTEEVVVLEEEDDDEVQVATGGTSWESNGGVGEWDVVVPKATPVAGQVLVVEMREEMAAGLFGGRWSSGGSFAAAEAEPWPSRLQSSETILVIRKFLKAHLCGMLGRRLEDKLRLGLVTHGPMGAWIANVPGGGGIAS